MDIKIGDKTYRTKKPARLDEALIAATGCNAAEAARHLSGWPTAGRIASALKPFLPDDAPSVAELAQAIAADENGPEILVAAKKLYAGADDQPATASGAAAAE